MLTDCYKAPYMMERLRSGPAGPYLDGFTDWLSARGYKRSVIHFYVCGADKFSAWLQAKKLLVESADENALRLYEEDLLRRGREGRLSAGRGMTFRYSAGYFLEYLCSIGVVDEAPASKEDGLPTLVRDFGEWMFRHRGSTECTMKHYTPIICDFIRATGDKPELYCAENVREFFFQRSKGMGSAGTQTVAQSLRMFLRFLIAMGKCPPCLDAAIPPLGQWRLSALPRYIAAEDVEKIIASCDANTATGARDKAMILLSARLGLRAGDVAELKLDDFDWRTGKVRVSGKTRRQTWLPLPLEVGECVSQYLLKWRPDTNCRSVFLTTYAPLKPVSRSVVSWATKKAIHRTGVDAPSHGAHLLRHSFATEMLRQGMSLDGIGAILRHSCIDTTAIYAKVDFELLKEVVRPWPGEVSPC